MGTLATCFAEDLSSLAGKCPGGSNLFDLSVAGFDGFMRQILLPRATLESKGLFTWLVQFEQKLRYLHPCEAARLFGFGPDFRFSVDLDGEAT